MYASLDLNELTPQGRVTQICVSKSDHHWSQFWLVTCSVPTYYQATTGTSFGLLLTLTACREPTGKLWQLCKVLYVFEHKNAIYFNPCSIYPHCYFDTSVTYLQWFRRVKFVLIPPRFVQQQYLWNIATQPAVGCYNSWANVRYSGCSLLGEISLWTGVLKQPSFEKMNLNMSSAQRRLFCLGLSCYGMFDHAETGK